MKRIYSARLAVTWIVVTAAALFATVGAVHAQGWKPDKHVELIVPTGAGGSLDATGRTIQRIWDGEKLLGGVTSSVVNKPGGGHAVGYTYMMEHKADPHYLSVTSGTLLTGHIVGRLKMTYTDVTPIAVLYSEYIAFAVRADSPIKDGKDLVAAMKKDPGALSIAISSAPGGTHHIAIASVLKAAGIEPKKAKVVAFVNSNEAVTAVLGKHVDLAVAGTTNVVGQMQAGNLRVIAISAPKRVTGPLASVPTWVEQGYNATFDNWRGIMAPKGITPEQVAFWVDTLRKATSSDEFRKIAEKQMWTDIFMGSKEATEFMQKDYERLKATLTSLGMVK
ncbi:MAG TPA: tripartite tricarboxylate transporter substrate binding protein [Burkholderiales bacterium]|nr:tripartite tricarboxylate transporter substrate binding protein [Burkholderiales bacterium]